MRISVEVKGRVSAIKRVAEWTLEFGGDEHTGSRGAGTPGPTPMRRVDLALAIIEEGPGSYTLAWRGPTEDTSNDSWHASVAEAIAAAESSFGIPADAWSDLTHPDQREPAMPVSSYDALPLTAPLGAARASMDGGGTSFSLSLATAPRVNVVLDRQCGSAWGFVEYG